MRISQTNKARGNKGGTRTKTSADISGVSSSVSSTSGLLSGVLATTNYPPVWALVPTIYAVPSANYDISRYALDPDGDTLTFAKVSGPAGISVSQSGVVVVTDAGLVGSTNDIFVSATDGESAPVTTRVTVSVINQSEVLFAEIPEIVFVRGYQESIHLGQFLIDHANRWAPGDIGNTSGWESSIDVSIDAVPPGVTFGSRTMRLDYDGRAGDTVSVPVRMTAGGSQSREFRVTILQPTVTWGAGGTVDPTLVAGDVNSTMPESWQQVLRTYTAVNGTTCILVLGGTYLNKTGSMTDFLANGGAGLTGRVYIIGEPGNRPLLQYVGVTQRLSIRNSEMFYIKNLEVDGRVGTTAAGIKWTPTSTHEMVLWGVKVQQNAQEPFSLNTIAAFGGQDSMTYAGIEAWMVECEGRNQGLFALSHMHYHHFGSFAEPYDMDPAYTFANRAFLHINNCYFGASPYGHTLKIESSTSIRNTLVQSADNLDDPALTSSDLTAYAPIQIHANMKNILYNNRIDHVFSLSRGQKMTLFVGCRNVNEGGGTLPPYWRDSAISNNPLTIEEIKARAGGAIYHGSTAPLSVYDTAPPSDVPWWNLIGYRPDGDPFNTHTYRAFIAYNTFNVPDVIDRVPDQQFNNYTRHDSSAPHQGLGSFAAQHYFLPVPLNWRNQTTGFLANNQYLNYQAAEWHVTNEGFGAIVGSEDAFPEGALPYVTTPLTILSDEASGQTDAQLPHWFATSFDALPTYPMRSVANAMQPGESLVFDTGLLRSQVWYQNLTTGTTDWILNYESRFLWIGDEAWFLGKGQFNTKVKVLRYSALSNAWDQIGPDNPQPEPTDGDRGHGYNHAAYDHVGRKLYFREFNDNRLKILDMDTGLWTISASMPESLTISAVAVAWHPHLFDDYSVRVRERASDFNGGVLLYAPTKLWGYNPATDSWVLIHDNGGVKYDGNYELIALYVRSLDAVVFGGGAFGTGKCWRIKHAGATPELLTTAPFNFGANQSSGGMLVDDPDGNGFLLLEKGATLGNAAWRWWSPDNSIANGAWTQIGDHPFNVGTPNAHWVPCTNEVDGVVMGICRPAVSTDNPVVKLWKPDPGFIPRFRSI